MSQHFRVMLSGKFYQSMITINYPWIQRERQYMKSNRHKTEYERCCICHKLLNVKKRTPVTIRRGYIEGQVSFAKTVFASCMTKTVFKNMAKNTEIKGQGRIAEDEGEQYTGKEDISLAEGGGAVGDI